VGNQPESINPNTCSFKPDMKSRWEIERGSFEGEASTSFDFADMMQLW